LGCVGERLPGERPELAVQLLAVGNGLARPGGGGYRLRETVLVSA